LLLATTRNHDLAVEGRPGPGTVIVLIAFRPRRHTGRKLVTVRPGASRLQRRPRPGVRGGRRLLPTLATRLLIGMRYGMQRPPERSRRHCCDRHTTQPRDILHSHLHEPLLCWPPTCADAQEDHRMSSRARSRQEHLRKLTPMYPTSSMRLSFFDRAIM
jgi:hypothetical protein